MKPSPLSSDLFLSLATAPVLMVLWGSRLVAELMTEAGQASEEVFRGDRLPVLKLSITPPTQEQTDSFHPIDSDIPNPLGHP